MKMPLYSVASALLALFCSSSLSVGAATEGMKSGAVALKSIGPLAFGPAGILFIADSAAAAIVAVDTGDKKAAGDAKPLRVEKLDQKIAGLLGTTADQILLNDLVVNPASRNTYIAVSRGRGPDAKPVLMRVTSAGELELVSLDAVKFARAELPDAPVDGVVGSGNRQSNPRRESITDIAYFEDRLLVAGLSNEEFASTLRAIPFPFKTVANGTSVEIYHGAHGKFETRAPVRTFVPMRVGNEPHLLAAYTCTPLVQFPVKDLVPGSKVRGKTVAELGNRNRPLDMIVYRKDGKDFLLLANSARGVMKISADKIAEAESITERVADKGGLAYETIENWKNVDQLDHFGDNNALVLRRADGSTVLESLPLP